MSSKSIFSLLAAGTMLPIAGVPSHGALATSVAPVRSAYAPAHRPRDTAPCFGSGQHAFLGGGESNTSAGYDSGVLSGDSNSACEWKSSILGGYSNSVLTGGVAGTIGGGTSNQLSAEDAVVAGGMENTQSGDYGFIGAGGQNTIATSYAAAIGGGLKNSISASNVGELSASGGSYSVIGGGEGNSIVGASDGVANLAVIGGGSANSVTSEFATLAGGESGTVTGIGASLGGGEFNAVSGFLGVVPGGYRNVAGGTTSFAAGYESLAEANGSFVWSDYSPGAKHVVATAPNQFLVRSVGGVVFYSNTAQTVGVRLAPGSGTWSSLSDRTMKTAIVPLDDAGILAKVAALPVSEWSYISERGVRHIGPMAQDFYAAFGVGEDDRHITTIDEDGVALAAVKALHQENASLRGDVAELRREVRALERDR
jgi:hypothetical protein